MRALRCNSYGPPESLAVEDLPDPVPGPGEVVVDIEAAAVNFPDVLIVANRYQMSAPVPFTPGSEFSGRVAAVGPGVEDHHVGGEVYGSCFVGAFAEKVVVPAAAVRPIPAGLGFPEAAGFNVV